MKKLSEYKMKILFKEFSFLSEILKIKNLIGVRIDEILIRKVDENLLAMTGEYEEYEFPYKGNYASLHAKEYFAIDNAGNIFKIPSAGCYCAQYVEDCLLADTIGEELLKLGVNPNFIILLERDYSEYSNKVEYSKFSLTIFKAGGFDMVGYHSCQFHRAAQALEAELRAATE